MALWHLASQTLTRLLLWRTSLSTFRVMQYDTPVDLLTNADYVLLDEKYEAVLHTLDGQVDFTRVRVTDTERNLVWDNYLELKIKQEATLDQIQQDRASGRTIYLLDNEFVFVSTALKAAFEQANPPNLEFYYGLSHFGA